MVKGFKLMGQFFAGLVAEVVIGMWVLVKRLNESDLPQGSEVLGDGGFGQGDLFGDDVKRGDSVEEEVFEYRDAGWVGKSFCPYRLLIG